MKREQNFDFDLERGITYWEEQNIIDKSRIDWELVARIHELKSRYKIHMLTDQIQLQNGASAWIDKINDHFHTILRSYEQGYRKPFPESYKNLLQKIGAVDEPQSVIFIDDNSKNVAAANELGIHGILYQFHNHDLLNNKFTKLNVF
jgi:FMN phosphatase YigB (HAD superfamily)